MKIVIGTPYFYPKMGGLENYAYKLAKGLQKSYGWHVVIITSNHKSKKDVIEKQDNMKIYRLAPLFCLSNTPINPFWIFKVWHILRKEKPDIINAHTPVPFMADVLSLVSLGTPFVVTYHATSLYKKKGSLFNSVVWIYKQIEHLLFLRADRIITVSSFVTNVLSKRYQKKATVISNFVDSFATKKIKKENYLIFIGSLDKTHVWKGLDKILKAIKILVDAYGKNVKLLIIGEGNSKMIYKKMAASLDIKKSVQFLGKRTGKEKNAYIKRAQAAVIYPTTSNDALPTFLLEAWANRTPVIASNIYPISRIIKQNTTGYLVEPNNSSQLAKGIMEVLASTSKKRKLESNGYKEVKTFYSYDNALKKFHSVLRKEIA